jgi:putative ABC transport system permease protein
MKYLFLAWSNMKRKKLRTVLTLLSIIVAFILFGLLSAFKYSMVGGVELAGKDRLIVRHKVSLIQLLPESYKARMERIPGVESAVYQTWFGGYYQDPKTSFFMQSPVVPEEFMAMFPEFVLPSEGMKSWQSTRTGAVVGRKTADKYNWKVGDKIPIFSQLWKHGDNQTWEFDLVGIYEGKEPETDTSTLFFRYDYFDEARDEKAKGQVGWYTIRIGDPSKAAEIAAKVDEEFANSPAETKTEPEGAFAQGFAQQIGNIALIVASIMAAVFFTILLVTGNTISQSVRERTGELGVLKAIGFTSKQVLGLVLLESCLLAVTGGAIGLGLAKLVTLGDPTKGLFPLFILRLQDIGIGAGISFMLGILTGIFPAMQAMRLRVADALRRM